MSSAGPSLRVLILGGTAFMGPFLVRKLAAAGHQVTVFHRGKTTSPLPPGVTTLRGDRHHLGQHLTDLRALKPDVVVDMIAFTRDDAADLVEVFAGHTARTVVASSCDVYRAFGRLIGSEPTPALHPADSSATPDDDNTPLTEASPLRTRRYPFRAQARGQGDLMYHYDKLDVEDVLAEHASRLASTVVRLPMVFGEGDAQRRLSPYLRRARAGQPVLLGETHAAWRTNRGYAENMAHAMFLAATDPRAAGQTFNAADAAAQTEAEFARAVLSAAGLTPDVRVVPDHDVPTDQRHPGDPRHHLLVDSTKLRSTLGHTDPTDLPTALSRATAWELSKL